jgi:ketosteroid isomerase-like protein
MRNARFVGALLLVLALGMPVISARADDKADIQHLFDRAAKLISQKNIDGLAKMTAPSATFVDMPHKTTQTVKQWQAEMKKAILEISTIQATITTDKVTVKGNQSTANVTEIDNMTMVRDKGHKYHEVDKETITLVKGKSGWMPIKFVVTSATITRDGKPFNPMNLGAGGQ